MNDSLKKALTVGLVAILVLGGGGFLIAKPADAATPADPLYAVDTLFEVIQRLTTIDPVAKAELEQAILDERAEELDTIVGDEKLATDVNIKKAIDAVDSQNARVQTQLDHLGNQEGLQDGALEQVQNRYEKQIQTHTENMNQIQNTVKNMGEETQIKLEKSVENMGKENGKNLNSTNDSEKTVPENQKSSGSFNERGNGNN
jgi:hypothetical protein